MNRVYVGDKGTEVIVDTGIDLATASITNIKVIKPTGEEITWEGEVTDSTKIVYVTNITTSEWDTQGYWKLQSYVELPVWKGLGETVQVFVSNPGF